MSTAEFRVTHEYEVWDELDRPVGVETTTADAEDFTVVAAVVERMVADPGKPGRTLRLTVEAVR